VLEGPLPDDAAGRWRLVLKEEHTATGDWSGHRVWPSALALLGHLFDIVQDARSGDSSPSPVSAFTGLRVLEIGCGLPLLASALASLGAEVCATDHPRALPKAEAAIQREDPSHTALQGLTASSQSRLRLRPLAWGRNGGSDVNFSSLCGFDGPVDLLIGADLVYDGFPVDALHETVVDALLNQGAIAILALQPRLFPMAAALKEPRLVASFLRRLAQQGGGWDVTARPAGPDAFGAAQQPLLPDGQVASKGLVIATVTPPGARALGRVNTLRVEAVASERQEAPGLSYQREDLGPQTLVAGPRKNVDDEDDDLRPGENKRDTSTSDL